MNEQQSSRRAALMGGLTTVLYTVVPLALTIAIFFGLEAIIDLGGETGETIVGSIVFIALGVAAGRQWGRALARLTGAGSERRMQLAGALTLIPSMLVVSLALAGLEETVIRRGRGPDLPIHNLYTLFFVPSAFAVAAASSFALGLVSGNTRTAGRIAALSGLGAAAAFLLVNVVMDLIGYRVGGPGAVQRFTMVTVTILGMVVASLVGGGILGWQLSREG